MRTLAPPVAGADRPVAGADHPAAQYHASRETAAPRRPLPPLESFQAISARRRDYVGPTDESNWVLPGRLMVGAFPGVSDDRENERLLSSILNCGVTTFVCLQREYDPDAPESAWRSGHAIRPYFPSASALAARHHRGRQLDFIHFAIEDCSVVEDDDVALFSRALAERLRTTDEVIYLHCWGGHGRAGTITCLLLHWLYGLDAASAMARCQFVHDLRKVPIVVGSPQTQTQRDQVCRVVNASLNEDKLAAADVCQSALLDVGRRRLADDRRLAENERLAEERVQRQLYARQEAARREKAHREAAREARRAQRKAGSVWAPSRTPAPDALPTLLRSVAVSDENVENDAPAANGAPRALLVPVASRGVPRGVPPPQPPAPVVVRTARIQAVYAPPPPTSSEAPTPPKAPAGVHKRLASTQSAGSLGSMTGIGGHGPPRKQPAAPVAPRRPAGAARPAGRPSGGRRIVATSLAQHQSLNGIVPRPPPGPRPPRRGPPS